MWPKVQEQGNTWPENAPRTHEQAVPCPACPRNNATSRKVHPLNECGAGRPQAGGVGTFPVQIAKALGAEVTAVCSTRNADSMRGIGAGTGRDQGCGGWR